MQEYDVALKLLLRGSAKLTMRELTGTSVETWVDVELSKLVQNTRVDLLGETEDKGLVHLELQSGNDATMPLRMAEYCLGVFRLFGRFPRQVLLYVGEAPLRMESELQGDDVWFRYRAVDIRDLDGDRLLESQEVGDTVIAILARLRDHKDAVRRILERIAGLVAAERETALGQLLILAGLRHFEETGGGGGGTRGAEEANSQRYFGQQSLGPRVQEGRTDGPSPANREALWCDTELGRRAPGRQIAGGP